MSLLESGEQRYRKITIIIIIINNNNSNMYSQQPRSRGPAPSTLY